MTLQRQESVADNTAPSALPLGTDAAAGGRRHSVVVVGAGVSGCACAAALAAEGLHVTLMNSAMDRVGLPAYGPDLLADATGWEQLEGVMGAIPFVLRSVWVGAAMKPSDGRALANIDRRQVSIETKRVLEDVPGLEFRQGFVMDVRVAEPESVTPRVRVETIFGEVFEADAAVIAVGLSLGGRTAVGSTFMTGGRYGEPASNGVRTALENLGVVFEEATLEVGPRVSAATMLNGRKQAGVAVDAERAVECASETTVKSAVQRAGEDDVSLREGRLVPVDTGMPADPWPVDYPPAPHWDMSLRETRILVQTHGGVSATPNVGGGLAWEGPVMSPDGAATGELYIAPGSPAARDMSERGDGRTEVVATRMPMSVSAAVAVGLSETGRVTLTSCVEPLPTTSPRGVPVWIVGRAAGARDYAESLMSGVRAAKDVVQMFGAGSRDGRKSGPPRGSEDGSRGGPGQGRDGEAGGGALMRGRAS